MGEKQTGTVKVGRHHHICSATPEQHRKSAQILSMECSQLLSYEQGVYIAVQIHDRRITVASQLSISTDGALFLVQWFNSTKGKLVEDYFTCPASQTYLQSVPDPSVFLQDSDSSPPT